MNTIGIIFWCGINYTCVCVGTRASPLSNAQSRARNRDCVRADIFSHVRCIIIPGNWFISNRRRWMCVCVWWRRFDSS